MEKMIENFRVGIAIVCILFIIVGMGCLCCSIYCSISTSEYDSEGRYNSPKIRRSRLQTQRRFMGEDQVPNKGRRSSKGSNKKFQSRRISFA